MWLSWLTRHPVTERSWVRAPAQVPPIQVQVPPIQVQVPPIWVQESTGGNEMFLSHIDVSLSPFLSNSNEKMSLGEIKKINNNCLKKPQNCS